MSKGSDRRWNGWNKRRLSGGFGPNVFPNPAPGPRATKNLDCWNEYWNAQARWEKYGTGWRCVQAAPIIAWMLKMDPATAKLELARRGCQWEWI
jgi:hypothetical protein